MFTVITLDHKGLWGKFLNATCAVDFEKRVVIPFGSALRARSVLAAESAVKQLNSGDVTADFYSSWLFKDCTIGGKPLSDSDPARAGIVNILGLDYVVPAPVADYVAHLRTLAANAMNLLKQAEQPCQCPKACKCHPNEE